MKKYLVRVLSIDGFHDIICYRRNNVYYDANTEIKIEDEFIYNVKCYL